MNITDIFSTREREMILRTIIYKTGPIGVNKTAREAELSKGLVSSYLNRLVKESILEKKDGKFFVTNNIKTKAIKILLNLSRFDVNIFSGYGFVKSAGLYGSYAKGSNTEDSDIDLWILTEETGEETLAKLTGELRKNLGDVRPLYLSRDKLELLKKEDHVFYHSLVFGSMIIHGEGIEEA